MRVRDYQPSEHIPGTVYQVVRLIGSGGMGTVYDVEDTTIGKRYVLKTLHSKLGAREDLARRIQHEARTLARLHHPNIVEVITAGVTADDLKLPYYVMERLSGQSLRLVLEKKGQLELAHAYHIGIDLLDALDHAHDKGVIHRDVKPDNIFLHRTLVGLTITKLLDFGIVSMLDASSIETAGRFLGTLRYAAPEQLRGEKPTPKTDVYSAGLVLYEIIAGRGPFDDEGDAHRIAAAHIHKLPTPVSHYASVPRDLDNLLLASLAKHPDDRPRDAFSFAASLRYLKRRVDEERPHDSTENRVTASAVIGPASTPRLLAQEPAVTGAFATSTSPRLSPAPASVPRPTAAGVPAIASAPAFLRETSPFPPPSSPSLDGRSAATHSVAFDTMQTPQHGTEPLAPAWPSAPPDPAFCVADTEIQWPQDRAPTPSDGPQVRSLPALPPPRRSARPIAVGVVGVAAIAVMAWGLVLGLRHVSISTASLESRALAAYRAVIPPEAKPAASIAPAPSTSPPPTGSEAPPLALAPSVVLAPTPRPGPIPIPPVPRSHARSAASSAAHPPKSPIATASVIERPGPGF